MEPDRPPIQKWTRSASRSHIDGPMHCIYPPLLASASHFPLSQGPTCVKVDFFAALQRFNLALMPPLRSADTATGVLEHAAEGFHSSSGATSAAATDEEDERYDDVPQSDDDGDSRSAGAVSVSEPSPCSSVTSEDEPLLDCVDYRKIRDLNRRALGNVLRCLPDAQAYASILCKSQALIRTYASCESHAIWPF